MAAGATGVCATATETYPRGAMDIDTHGCGDIVFLTGDAAASRRAVDEFFAAGAAGLSVLESHVTWSGTPRSQSAKNLAGSAA